MWFFIALASAFADVSALFFAFGPSDWLHAALFPAALGALFLALGLRETPKASGLVALVALGLALLQFDFFAPIVKGVPWAAAAVGLAVFHPSDLPSAARLGLLLAGIGSGLFVLLLALTDVDGDLVMIPLWVAVAGFGVAWRVWHGIFPESSNWFYLATVAAHTVQAFQLLVPETPMPGNVVAYTLVLYYTGVLFFVGVELWSQSLTQEDELFSLN